MNIKPFEYGMNVLMAYDNGSILNKDIVSLTESDIIAKF